MKLIRSALKQTFALLNMDCLKKQILHTVKKRQAQIILAKIKYYLIFIF